MAIERSNSGFDAFTQLPDGERLYAQIMTKCVKPFGLDVDTSFGQRVLNRIAQKYKESRSNNLADPATTQCFIEAMWGLATSDLDKFKLDLTIVKKNDLTRLPEERFPAPYKIKTLAIPEGATFTFRQAHGIVAKDGKTTRASYYSVQQEGHSTIGFFLYTPPTDLSIVSLKNFHPYEEVITEITHPVDSKARERRRQTWAQEVLALPAYNPKETI